MSKLFQVSLLQALTLSEFDGQISIKELKKHGDIGIGTYEGLNGELVMLDGKAYQAQATGIVKEASEDATTPFAAVSNFNYDYQDSISASSLAELLEKLTAKVEALGCNNPYMVKIHTVFDHIIVRSIMKQEKPYKMLNVAIREGQREFSKDNIAGTIVGLYCPSYMDSVNVAGWHCHFIADDISLGGHLYEAKFSNGKLDIQKISEYELRIPSSEKFNAMDLKQDLSKEIEESEKKA